MTDGTVMVQGSGSAAWVKLTPDQFGSYVNGTWSTVASLPAGYAPLYYASAVLADGRLVVIGGEYNNDVSADTNLGAIYDPRSNTWTALTPPAGWPNIGDAPSVVLPNGMFLLGNAFDTELALLNPATLTWTEASSTGKLGSNNEEGYTLLPDGTLIDANVDASPATQRYLPSLGEWISAGNVPQALSEYLEMGPAILRPDGTVFQAGASGANAVYTPPTTLLGTGTWTAAPSFPNIAGQGQLDIADGPACLLPDGNVLMAASPGAYNAPITFFEFDGTNLTQAPTEPDAAYEPSYAGRLITLPTGQAFWTAGDAQIYTPIGTPNPAWAPTITSFPATIGPDATYPISGTQFNGLSQASGYGDDYQAATNYPLVRITNQITGHVFYARTHDHSTMAVATGSAIVSTNFDVPPTIELGPSSLVVVTNGIPSSPVSVTVGSLNASGTVLVSSSDPSTGGQAVTFTAVVTSGSGGTPTGTVTFYDGITRIGTGTLNGSAVATFTTSSLSGGAHSMTATYSGDSNFSSSTSTAFTQTVVNLTASATALLSSINPVAIGQPVTFTATVTSNGSLTTTPTGSVTFYNGTSIGTGTLNGSGVATFTTSSLTAGSHTIEAVYFGDTNYDPSTSGPVLEVVDIGTAAMPTFSPLGGAYSSPQQVTISSATLGAPIYYTTDGSTPTTASFLYTVPVAVTSSETINAIAAGDGYSNSSTGSAAYVINNVLGVISTYAGNGTAGYGGDGGAATSAELYEPWATAVDSSGNLYIADEANQRVRKVTPAGVISTVAGNGTGGYSGDGGQATSAELDFPLGVAVDAGGNLYISDNGNNRIRMVTPAGVIFTYAGNGTGGFHGDGGQATSAEINAPRGIAVDIAGNLYIADIGNQRVRKVTQEGLISTVAGNGTAGYSGDGGAATSAELYNPIAVAVDAGMNLYISDNATQHIRKVTAAGLISTVAGNGTYGFSGDGGPATSAELQNPIGVAVDSSGNLYIADASNERIRRVTPEGAISTVAGTGTPGYSGDGGAATGAELFDPFGVTVDSSGNLFIAEFSNQRIRKVTYKTTSATALLSSVNPVTYTQPVTFTATVSPVGTLSTTPTGTVTFYDGTTSLGIGTLNGSGVATFTTSSLTATSHTVMAAYGGDGTFAPSTSGPVEEVVNVASAAMPTFSPLANTYTSPQTVTISSTTPGAAIYYTTDGSTPTTASLLYTAPVAVTSSETISAIAVVSGYNNSSIGTAAYVINDVAGIISTYAGNGTQGYGGDGGAATSAELDGPTRVAVDRSGNLYIVDLFSNSVRKVTPAGVISTVAGNGTAGYSGDGGPATSAELDDPTGVALDSSGNLYIADNGNNRVREVTVAGVISTYAGNGIGGYYGDGGLATNAELKLPVGVGVDASGNLYIADSGNSRVRKVTPAGTISTFAGNGTSGYGGDGGVATSAELNVPQGVAADGSGSLYIADEMNNRIRKVTPAGVISTVAGNGAVGYNGDGGAATSAELFGPYGVAVDSSGNLYIADLGNDRVRKVKAGVISTVAGNGAFGFSGDGGLATAAEINNPDGVAVDSSGNLYIGDYFNQRVRKVTYEFAFATTTTLVSSQNPSIPGQAVTLTATVSSGDGPPPNGEGVFFFNNGQALNTSPALLSGGVATFTTSVLPLGTNPITATYGGDSTFLPSGGSLSQVVSVGVPPQVGYVAYWGINNTGITVSWSTDVPATTQLAYGTSPSLGLLSPLQTALTASHGV
ncbi:MAG: Ig-like domain repeat protein, partial [Acidobacteriaceae bacterium]